MPPPTRLGFNKPLSSQSQRPSLREQVSQPHFEDPDPESLFLPEDRTWDPPNYDGNDDEEEEMLGWDAANERAGMDFQRTFRDSGSVAPPPRQQRQRDAPASQTPGLEPTQSHSSLLITCQYEAGGTPGKHCRRFLSPQSDDVPSAVDITSVI
ncbi:hypothetical protein KC334_g22482, partial [Hortaea werneckii]